MPPDRFAQLSDETKDFLANLRTEDVHLLEEGISLVRSIRTVSAFVKWLLVGILGAIGGTWAALKLFGEIIASIKGAK